MIVFPQFQTTLHLSPLKGGRRGAGPDTAGRSDAPPETTTYEKKVGWLRALRTLGWFVDPSQLVNPEHPGLRQMGLGLGARPLKVLVWPELHQSSSSI